MTKLITTASTAFATAGLAAVFTALGRMLSRPAQPEQPDGALSPRLAQDSGLSDIRPASGEGSAPAADPLAREMMRRSY